MGKIVKLKDKDGNSVLPATIPGAVVDPDTGRTMKGFMPCANKDSGIDIDATSYTGYGLSVIGVERMEADGTFPSGATSDDVGGIILQGHYQEDGLEIFTQLFMSNKGVFYRRYTDPDDDKKPFDGVSWTQLCS